MIILEDLLESMYYTEEVYLTSVSDNGIETFQGTARNLLNELSNDILHGRVDHVGVDEGDLFVDMSY